MSPQPSLKTFLARGANLAGIGGVILIGTFFLPWVSFIGVGISGWNLAQSQPWLWLVPLCGLAASALAWLDRRAVAPALAARRSLAWFSAGSIALIALGISFLGYALDAASWFSRWGVNLGSILPLGIGSLGAGIGAGLLIAGAAVEARAPAVRPRIESEPPPPDRAPRAFLHGRTGALAGQVFEISHDYFKIGRSSDSQIRILDLQVSRVHAVIRVAQGRYYVQDQDSANGTQLNGQPVDASVLAAGDALTIGDTTFVFVIQ